MVARNLEVRNLQSIRVHHSAAANTVRNIVGYAICLFAFLVASLCSVPLHVAVTKISERREDRARLIGRYVNYFFTTTTSHSFIPPTLSSPFHMACCCAVR